MEPATPSISGSPDSSHSQIEHKPERLRERLASVLRATQIVGVEEIPNISSLNAISKPLSISTDDNQQKFMTQFPEIDEVSELITKAAVKLYKHYVASPTQQEQAQEKEFNYKTDEYRSLILSSDSMSPTKVEESGLQTTISYISLRRRLPELELYSNGEIYFT